MAAETRCNGQVFETCQNGQFAAQMDCTASHVGTICDSSSGCVTCTPGMVVCAGNEVHHCNADGTLGDLVQTCSAACVSGGCPDACSQAAAAKSYIGCEYWAVDLDNAIEVRGSPSLGLDCQSQAPGTTQETLPVCAVNGFDPAGLCDPPGNDCSAIGPPYTCMDAPACVFDAQHSPFAIVVANPEDGEDPITVTISNGDGVSRQVTVPARTVVPIFPQQLGFPDQSLDMTSQERKSYKLVSSRPIVAYQFNPLDNVGVFSDDASLLLPVHTFDTTYVALTWPTLVRRPLAHDYHGYVTIVASAPGTTHVTVDATARVSAGPSLSGFGPGSRDFALQQYEALNLEADGNGPGGGDLTGTRITGDQPFGVFVGHEATTLTDGPSTQSPCCADHLEEQLFPASTWGHHYAIAHSQPRASAPDVVRVLALRASTQLTWNPAPSGNCGTLGAGEFCDVSIQGDTELTASDPVLVGHFLVSTGGIAPDSGDPSLALSVPVEQFRTDYTFLVPMQYNANYVSLVARTGSGPVVLDGMNVASMLTLFGSGALRAARLPLQAGQHAIQCPDGCGIEVYGWAPAVSYMFAGGLNLNQIVIP
jgi:hypothetical protein